MNKSHETPQLYTFQLPDHEDYCGTYIGHGVIDKNNKFSGKLLPATDPEKIILAEPNHTATELTGLSVTNVAPIVDLQPQLYKFQITGYEESHSKTFMLSLGTIDDQNRFTGTLKHENYGRDLLLPAEYDAKSDPDYTHGSAYGTYGGGAGSNTVAVTSLPITNISLVQQQEQTISTIYPALTTTEKQELSGFTAIVKHHFPEAPTDSIHKLCNIASDIKRLTIQNTNGILSNEKYNYLTDTQEKQIETITAKNLPGTIASLPYDATAPALKLNIPSSDKGHVMSTYTVPEIPKNKLTIAPVAAKTATEIVSKKR